MVVSRVPEVGLATQPVPRTHTRIPLLVGIFLATTCGRDRREPASTPGPSIEIALDDRTLRRAELGATPTPLAALVEATPAGWLEVVAASADGRSLELAQPARTYPDGEIRLYLDQGRAAIGVFRRPSPDMPPSVATIVRQPIVSLVGVADVTVRTRPAAMPPLVIRVGGTEQPVAEALRSLARAPQRKPRERGWTLGSVVGLAVTPEHSVGTVRLRARGGAVTPLPVDVLREPSAILKLNQHGLYVFRMWDTTGKRTLEVRDVTSIEIE